MRITLFIASIFILSLMAVTSEKMGFEVETSLGYKTQNVINRTPWTHKYTVAHQGQGWALTLDEYPPTSDATDSIRFDFEFVTDPFAFDNAGSKAFCAAINAQKIYHANLYDTALRAWAEGRRSIAVHGLDREMSWIGAKGAIDAYDGHKTDTFPFPDDTANPQATIGIRLGRVFSALNILFNAAGFVPGVAGSVASVSALLSANAWNNAPLQPLTPRVKDFVFVLADLWCGGRKIALEFNVPMKSNRAKRSQRSLLSAVKEYANGGVLLRINPGKIYGILTDQEKNEFGNTWDGLRTLVKAAVEGSNNNYCTPLKTWYKKNDPNGQPSGTAALGAVQGDDELFFIGGYGPAAPFWNDGPTVKEFFKGVLKGNNPLQTHLLFWKMQAFGKMGVDSRTHQGQEVRDVILLELRNLNKIKGDQDALEDLQFAKFGALVVQRDAHNVPIAVNYDATTIQTQPNLNALANQVATADSNDVYDAMLGTFYSLFDFGKQVQDAAHDNLGGVAYNARTKADFDQWCQNLP